MKLNNEILEKFFYEKLAEMYNDTICHEITRKIGDPFDFDCWGEPNTKEAKTAKACYDILYESPSFIKALLEKYDSYEGWDECVDDEQNEYCHSIYCKVFESCFDDVDDVNDDVISDLIILTNKCYNILDEAVKCIFCEILM